jgi:hypothetical protein
MLTANERLAAGVSAFRMAAAHVQLVQTFES